MMNTKIATYSATISKYPLLTHEEERTASKQTLIFSNIRLVMSIAARYTRSSDEYKDFVSEGMIGLMTAAERYVWRSNCTFSTYAGLWIRSAIGRAKGTIHDTIRVPETYAKKHDDYARVTLSLDGNPDSEDDDVSYYDMIGDKSARTGEDDLCRKEDIAHIRDVFSTLQPRERDILCRSAGVGYDKEQSLAEIGQAYGVCKERIRQIRNAAENKVRRQFASAF
jgi:RNA polymerase primary sigma factor